MGGGVGSRGVEVGVGVCCAGPPVAIRVRGQRHSLRCVGGGGIKRDAAQRWGDPVGTTEAQPGTWELGFGGFCFIPSRPGDKFHAGIPDNSTLVTGPQTLKPLSDNKSSC